MKSAYNTLGINKSASAAEIKTAFKQLALKHHPDRNPNDLEASKRFKEISEAYNLLKDPKRRAQYDKYGSRDEFAKQPFEDFFGNSAFGTQFNAPFGRRRSRTRGRHIRLNCALSLRQFWLGASFKLLINTKVECEACKCKGRVKCNKRVKCRECNGRGTTRTRQGIVTFEQTCSVCKGSGTTATERCKKCGSEGRLVGKRAVQFDAKPGTAINTVLKLDGLGEAGIRGARAGSLYVRFSASAHSFYNAYGSHLFCTLAVSPETVGFGGRLEFKTVIGTPLTLIVPKFTPADNLFVLRQRGLPSLTGGLGDLHVKLSVHAHRYGMGARPLRFSKRLLKELFSLFIKLRKLWTPNAPTT